MNFEDVLFLERLRAEDSTAIREVVEAYLPQILNTARAAGLGSHLAEDVTQATFTTFIEKVSTFEGRSHVRTWLFGILYRKIAEARRGLDRSLRHDDIDDVVSGRFNQNGTWSHPPPTYGGIWR